MDTIDKSKLERHFFETIELDFQNHIMTLTLNRPDKKNAINDTLSNEFNYALSFAKQECGVRVVVLAAKGNVFCAGADLKSFQGQKEKIRSTVPRMDEKMNIASSIRDLHKPVIAKVQGPVLAGALLMICNATHVVAADHVYFCTPEIKRGLWPYMVMTGLFRVMPRRVGLDFIMRGFPMNAWDAKQNGLVSEVVPADLLGARVAELANELAKLAPSTMQMGLEAFYHQELMSMEDALPYLKMMLEKTVKSEDAQEGITAFFEKREPQWNN